MKWSVLCVWEYFCMCALSKVAIPPDQRVTHTPLVIAMTLSVLIINPARLDVCYSDLAFPLWLVQPYIPVSWQSVSTLSHVWIILYSWFRASWLSINKIQRDSAVCRYLCTAKLLYMFRVSIAPIISSTSNCNCSFWYRSYHVSEQQPSASVA